MVENPYEPQVSDTVSEQRRAETQNGSMLWHAAFNLFVPGFVAFCSIMAISLNWLGGASEYYVSLFVGIPWALVAVVSALYSWTKRHRLVAAVAVAFWLGLCGINAWVAFAFRGG